MPDRRAGALNSEASWGGFERVRIFPVRDRDEGGCLLLDREMLTRAIGANRLFVDEFRLGAPFRRALRQESGEEFLTISRRTVQAVFGRDNAQVPDCDPFTCLALLEHAAATRRGRGTEGRVPPRLARSPRSGPSPTGQEAPDDICCTHGPKVSRATTNYSTNRIRRSGRSGKHSHRKPYESRGDCGEKFRVPWLSRSTARRRQILRRPSTALELLHCSGRRARGTSILPT